MSVFMDMFCEMLPQHSALQDSDNQLRTVLDKSVGEFMDSVSTEVVFDGLFLQTASGGWLDAHGVDFGVVRRDGESDESYRERIIFEKLEYLTVHNLLNIYGLTLYVFVDDFDASENCLTSDNPYISSRYMSVASDELKEILNKKFVLDGEITWLESDGV